MTEQVSLSFSVGKGEGQDRGRELIGTNYYVQNK